MSEEFVCFSSVPFQQSRQSDRNRKKVEYPEVKPEDVPPVMVILSEK